MKDEWIKEQMDKEVSLAGLHPEDLKCQLCQYNKQGY